MAILFGAAMVLFAFLALNAAASLVSAGLAAVDVARQAHPARRARTLLALRLLPAVVSLAAVAVLVIPAYVRFEPHDTGESVSPALGALAAVATAVVLAGLARGLRAAWTTARLLQRWRRRAEPVALPQWPGVVFRVRDAFPVVSVAGLWRARVYVSAQVLDALTPSELTAALAHERAHMAARDNLKRLLLRSCPDLLAWTRAGERLEREWARAAEQAADSAAAAAGGAVDLAASIVKVARLVPAGTRALPVSALHDGGDVAARVRALLSADAEGTRSSHGAGAAPRALTAALVVAVSLLAASQAWPAVHRLLEAAALLLR
jgi:peptidase M48-like protein